jgi:hypothetical protein
MILLRILSVSLGAFVLAFACHSEPLREGRPNGDSSDAAAGGSPSAPEDGGNGGTGGGGQAGAGGHPGTLVFDAVHISSDSKAEHFQTATTSIDFGTTPLARATLRVELESPCFPFDKWTASSIPEGHRWPATCDAFDRTLQLSLDDPEGIDEGPPGLELARAITPFGGPLALELDVTDLANGLPGSHRLKLEIPTWPDPEGQVSGERGEWIVSAWLELEPGTPPRRVLAVVPLAYTPQAAVDGQPIDFETPAGTGWGRIEYRVTGHGGGPQGPRCIGPAEEFCRREHGLYVDGELVDEFTPWRSDCAALCTPAHYESALLEIDYCAENPCGDPRSVRASRANWCPGSLTSPRAIESAALAVAGVHRFSWSIDTIADGGSWLLSATYYAYE